jgi:hypothetical protein
MTSQECFGVAVRVVGLAVLLFCIYQVATIAVYAMVGDRGMPGKVVGLPVYLALVSGVLGCWLVRGAGALQRFAYPGSSSSTI